MTTELHALSIAVNGGNFEVCQQVSRWAYEEILRLRRIETAAARLAQTLDVSATSPEAAAGFAALVLALAQPRPASITRDAMPAL
ncbi:MAG: hypothetical protein ACOZAH_09060 [Pseudomonadota bacterium]